MAFEKLLEFTNKVSDLPDKPNTQLSAEEVKTIFDSAPNEVREYLNKLIDSLKAPEAAGEIGVGQFSSNPADLQGTLEWLKSQIDFTTLGQIADGAITPSKLSTDAKKASIITVQDTAGVFTAANVEDVLKELFTFADNGKKDIASVIGSPATNGDSFAQLKTHIQNSKNNLASNLTTKGQSSNGTETLGALVAKVANVNTGKRFASGTVASGNVAEPLESAYNQNYSAVSYYKAAVSGLDFTPSHIQLHAHSGSSFTIYKAGEDLSNQGNTQNVAVVSSGSVYGGVGESPIYFPAFYVKQGQFTLPVSSPNTVYKWIAYE